MFSKESFDELPEWKQWDHAIDLKPESQPLSTKVYLMSPIEQKELDDFLEENLSSGRIVTFHNTHSNFADIIQAEIFEPEPSNLIPHPSHNFAHLCAFPHISGRFRHSRNHQTAFRALSRPCLQMLRSITLALIVSNSLTLLLYYDL